MIQTVTDNKKYFSQQEIEGANTSRNYQEFLYYPGTVTFKDHVKDNLITNCEVIVDEVIRAELIHGPPVPYLEGHMTRKRPLIYERIENTPLPPMIAQNHLNISITIEFFFVNGNTFFHSKSGKVNFLTAQYRKSRSLQKIMTV